MNGEPSVETLLAIGEKFFHEIGRADELGSGVRNLYHYVKLYSGAEPVFDEEDIFRLTVPLNAEYSPEKVHIGVEKPSIDTKKASIGTEKVSIETEKPSIDPEKPSIGSEKASIGTKKVSIDRAMLERVLDAKDLTRPTLEHILALFDRFGSDIFGRSQIMDCVGLEITGAGKLLNAMLRLGLLDTVVGQGKGKYRFSLRKEARA